MQAINEPTIVKNDNWLIGEPQNKKVDFFGKNFKL